jgi:glc operon protein GlcG
MRNEGGRSTLLSFPNIMPAGGGLPIVVDGKVIGAVGVSGATGGQDVQCVKAGVDALMKLLGR